MHDQKPLGPMLGQCAHLARERMDARMSRFGMTPAQTHVLRFLRENGGQMPQRALLEKLKVKPSTVSGSRDRMEERGRGGGSVSGAGAGGPIELMAEVDALSKGESYQPKVFQYQIAYNVIPQIGGEAFEGYTSEEMKMQNEGRKIMHLPELKVSCTCVRVPVVRSHSVSIVVRTKEKISVERARELIAAAPGCRLVDDLKNKQYPMPLDTSDQDTVFVGRIRDDLTSDNGLNIWCCGDQVRKCAATNAVQIAQLLLE